MLGETGSNDCKNVLQSLVDLCSELGVPIQEEKTVHPTTCIVFMWITLDSELMEARLPHEKIIKIKEKINEMINCKKTTLRQLQSLIDLLNLACCVVPPGRAFLRRITDLTRGLKYPHHRRWVTKEAKEDLLAWLKFIVSFNGKSVISDNRWLNSEEIHLFTDASGIGFGLILGNEWACAGWPVKWQSKNITIRELFPIFLALKLWGSAIENKCIVFHTDNEAVVHIINNQTCKDEEIMQLVREMVVTLMQRNILFRAVHIKGILNLTADFLSRMQMGKFREQHPTANQWPTKIPQEWLPH